MNEEQKNILDRLEATLKARSVARTNALMAVVKDDPIEFQRIANRHERMLDHAVFLLADEINVIDPNGGLVKGVVSPLRQAAVDMIREIR
jgi:hypothetical protein